MYHSFLEGRELVRLAAPAQLAGISCSTVKGQAGGVPGELFCTNTDNEQRQGFSSYHGY